MLQHLVMETRWRPHSAIRQVIGGRFVLHRRKVPCLAREFSCSNVGSALCSSSSFKHSTQPSCAAMSTGVAPVSALAWCMSALCSTSYRTTSPWPPFAAKHIGSRIGPSSPGADGSAPSSSNSLHTTASCPSLTVELVGCICYFGNGNTPEAMFADRCSDLRCG